MVMYPQAIYQSMTTMGPTYLVNIYKWFKMALWDAPYRIWLDIELEKLAIERNLSAESVEEK
jgi:hypothetical protein